MALDTRIPLQINPPEITDPAVAYSRALTNRRGEQILDEGALQLEETKAKAQHDREQRQKDAQVSQILAKSASPYDALESIYQVDPDKAHVLATKNADQAMRMIQGVSSYQALQSVWPTVQKYVGPQELPQFASQDEFNSWKREQALAHVDAKTFLEQTKPSAQQQSTATHVVGGALVDNAGKVLYTAPEKATPAAAPQGFTLAPGGRRYDAEGKLIATAPERPAQSSGGGGAGAPTSGGLDESGLELAATRFRITGTLPARDSKQNAAIMNAAAKQAKELGLAPAVTIQKQAAYKGDAAALQAMQKASASAEAFESKAIAQTGIIRDLSKQVPRTSWPIINRALQAGRTEISGDPNATMLANAVETFSEEYAKIMGGATGSAAGATDSSRAAAKRLINTAMSHGTMDKVLDLMQREMDLTMQGYDATISHISQRMNGGAVPTQTEPASAPGGVERWERGADGKLRKVVR